MYIHEIYFEYEKQVKVLRSFSTERIEPFCKYATTKQCFTPANPKYDEAEKVVRNLMHECAVRLGEISKDHLFYTEAEVELLGKIMDGLSQFIFRPRTGEE